MSYIADAFELARKAGFQDILADKTKYYRVVSPLAKLDNSSYSIVYLRFIHENETIDYIEVSGPLLETKYNNLIALENKINFSSIGPSQRDKKDISVSQEQAKKIFEENILTYFSFDRAEIPAQHLFPK